MCARGYGNERVRSQLKTVEYDHSFKHYGGIFFCCCEIMELFKTKNGNPLAAMETKTNGKTMAGNGRISSEGRRLEA